MCLEAAKATNNVSRWLMEVESSCCGGGFAIRSLCRFLEHVLGGMRVVGTADVLTQAPQTWTCSFWEQLDFLKVTWLEHQTL